MKSICISLLLEVVIIFSISQTKMALQLYQVDNKSYLLDFKSLSPTIDDGKAGGAGASASLSSSMNETMGKTVFHESFNNTTSESVFKKRASGM